MLLLSFKFAQELRFVNGKYVGKTGWIDASCPATKFMVYVIVDLGLKGNKHTRVKKENVA